MASMKLDQVPVYASQIRKSLQPDNPAEAFIVTEIGSPMFGSFNLLYPVIFEDGLRWLLKVPATGTPDQFSDADAESLRSEALTMRLLRKETTIPLPEVFAFENSCENQLNCPFILISFIEGKKLSDVWFDKTSPKDVVHARRTRSLQDIAASMIQLDKYSFDKGGSLVFDKQDQLYDIGSMRFTDSAAMLKRLINNDPDDSPIYIEAGPFSDPKAYYTCRLDNRGEQGTTFETGELHLLRMFFDSMEKPCDGRKPFVLEHPDFDIQNFIVSEEGELLGIIDWDGVCSVPRTVGNERFPGWLTRDWDPTVYVWNEDMEQGIKPDGIVWEDSPDSLKLYRSVYASAMRTHQHNKTGTTTATLTTNSLIYENLLIAAGEPLSMNEIVMKVFEEIAALVQEDLQQQAEKNDESENEEDFDVFSVLEALGENRLSENYRKVLMLGIQKLVEGSAEL
ncbi:unnamed protein product [Penicillium olsonii]|uniref:Aminoglycoside phosphotransferase domain-containing protein n=1 Tax=Penicillium olsonii TaxID=99116 RepID=A0A9W4MRD0_PENOL|nr:unnamed protein product [Penicillium olsonii]CAG8277283.1 unnamed protein product [Penicillium olsonii]